MKWLRNITIAGGALIVALTTLVCLCLGLVYSWGMNNPQVQASLTAQWATRGELTVKAIAAATETAKPTNTPSPSKTSPPEPSKTNTATPIATPRPSNTPTAAHPSSTPTPRRTTSTPTTRVTATARSTNTQIPATAIAAAPPPPPSATFTPVPTTQPTNPPTATIPPVPTATQPPPATPTLPPPSNSDISITSIFYNGVQGRAEPDEYVEIRNNGTQPINLGGWTLSDQANHVYGFPGFDIQPGQTCRIYTNENHPEWCGFSYGNGSAIWNNDGDCATLRDNIGTQVAQRCY